MDKQYFFAKFKQLQLLIIIMTLFCISSHAQYNHLLHKNFSERNSKINAILDKLKPLKKDVLIFKEIDKIRNFARENKDTEFELELDFIEVNWIIFLNASTKRFGQDEIFKRFDSLLERTTKNKLQELKSRVLWSRGNYCWNFIGNYELGFESYYLLDAELNKIRSEDFPEMAWYTNTIGEAFYFFQDYNQAKHYFKKGAFIPENNSNSSNLNSMKNNLGLCYQKLNKLDSAAYFFKKVMDSKPLYNHERWTYIAKGNLGYTYYLNNQYHKAMSLFKESIKGNMKFEEYGCVNGALIPLADIYLKKGNMKDSWECISKAKQMIDVLTNGDDKLNRLRLFYPLLSKWHQVSGNKELAIKYLDSTIIVKDSCNKKFSVLQLLRAQQKNAIQERQIATFSLINEKQKKTNERNLILFVLVTITLLFSGIYLYQKKSFQKQKRIQDLKLTIASQNLQMASQQLQDFTDKLIEKNHIIEMLQEQPDVFIDNEIVQQIKKSTILTADDWEKFQSLFEKVHAGFLNRLTSQYKELTASEIRYITLSKLNLSQKEMASILGISPSSVRVTWHRVSKKLNLSDKDTLENFLQKL